MGIDHHLIKDNGRPLWAVFMFKYDSKETPGF